MLWYSSNIKVVLWDEIKKYNNVLSINKNYIPSVLHGSEYYVDMRNMSDKLKEVNVEHVFLIHWKNLM